MRIAFDSRDVSQLQEVAANMDDQLFLYHLKRCIDSGLWLTNSDAANSDDDRLANDADGQIENTD